MADCARYALHRPELHAPLEAGERKIAALMKGTAKAYRANHVLIQENTDHPYVYRMIRGWACRIRKIGDGRDQGILMFLPGDLFAVKSMFVTRHPDSIRVLAPSLIECVHHQELHRLHDQDSDVADRCIWQVIEEERRLHNWVVGLGRGSAEERVAMLLTDFHGRLRLAKVVAQDAMAFEMPLTQAQLADHLGLTAVHVNRVLRSFREKGIATVRAGEVRIENATKLRQIAYPLLDPYERTQPEYAGIAP